MTSRSPFSRFGTCQDCGRRCYVWYCWGRWVCGECRCEMTAGFDECEEWDRPYWSECQRPFGRRAASVLKAFVRSAFRMFGKGW